MHEECKVQVPGAYGRGGGLGVARPRRRGLAGSGRGDQGAVAVRRPDRSAVDAVPGRAAGLAPAGAIAGFSARGHVVVPRVGLVFPPRLPFEAWAGVGAQLAVVAASSAWCLGDWLAFGQAAYGRRYREAVERTGLEYQTLRNYAWVAGRFELSRRRDSLSFGHHAEVAALPGPEQDFWLRKAGEFGWSTSQLRWEVRASLAERGQGPPGLEPAGAASGPGNGQGDGRPVIVRVRLTPEQLESCERAAQTEGMTLVAWAARALEWAVRERLPSHAHC